MIVRNVGENQLRRGVFDLISFPFIFVYLHLQFHLQLRPWPHIVHQSPKQSNIYYT